MNTLRNNLNVHFIGIGGVSMSALAKYLFSLGFSVSGSDISKSRYTDELIKSGIKVYIGHSADNLKDVQVVIYNDAINDKNEELLYAKQNGLYLLKRAELLKMVSENFKRVIGVCGCHGKTTATSMLANLLFFAKEKFTSHIGGDDKRLKNMYSSGGDIFLTEVCEFKKNINLFTADIAVCLNIDKDHLDSYSSFEELKESYYTYLKRSDTAVIFDGDKELKKYDGNNKITFGSKKTSDYYYTDEKEKNGKYSFKVYKSGKYFLTVRLGVYGKHNILNALSATATADNAFNILCFP